MTHSNNRLNLTISNILLSLYCVIVFLNIYSLSTFPQLTIFSKLRTIVLILMAMIALFFQKHSIYQLSIFGILLLLTISSKEIYNASNEYILIVLLVFALSNGSPRKILKCSTIVTIVMLLLIIASSMLGLIDNYIYFRDGIIRESLGISYPTILSAIIFFLLCAEVLICRMKINKLLEIIILFLIAFFIYRITYAKNDAISMMLLIVPILSDKWNKSVNKIIASIGAAFTVVLGLISVFITSFLPYTTNLYFKLNNLFSNRLYFQSLLFQRYPLQLLGQYVYQSGYGGGSNYVFNYFYIDNSFTRMMFLGGILFFVIFILCYLMLIFKLIKVNLYKISFILIIILLNAIVEESFIRLALNTFLPLILISKYKFEEDFK